MAYYDLGGVYGHTPQKKRKAKKRPSAKKKATKKKPKKASTKKRKVSRKKAPRKTARKSPKKKVARGKKTRKAWGAQRVVVPADLFYEWRDERADWPDGYYPRRRWITYKGKRYWPHIVQQHSLHAFEGAKGRTQAKALVEFVAAGSPLDK